MALRLILTIAFLITTIAWTDANISVHNPFYCFSHDPIRPQMANFATLAPYEAVRGQHIDPNVSSCTPSKFWIFTRHGNRLPSIPEIENMLEIKDRIQRDILANYDAGRTSLCADDVELIRNWEFNPNATLDSDLDLTESGWYEMQDMAERFQAAFPTLLPPTYSPSHFFFRPSNTQRTLESLWAFADGLFGPGAFEQVHFESGPVPDLMMVPWDHCPLHNEVIADLVERDAFRDGPEFQEMLTQVSTKLGFHGSQHLTLHDINTILNICRYEQGWNITSSSPLCSAFSIANHHVHEYITELASYYQYGYGRPEYRILFENFNCHFMQDMLRFLESRDPEDHTARIFNGHLITLKMIMVTFGALEDEVHLTRHNYAQQLFRLWNAANISPMGGNLAVIRYE